MTHQTRSQSLARVNLQNTEPAFSANHLAVSVTELKLCVWPWRSYEVL